MPEKLMNDKFTTLIDAVCYWLGFQVKIGRENLIHEASLRYPIADAITSKDISISQIKLEDSHPLFKSKRIDLVIHEIINDSNQTLRKEIYEFKIAKHTKKEDDEHQRVFDDIVRLAFYNMVEKEDCYFLMCGKYENFKQYFVEDKIEPNVVDGRVLVPPKVDTIRGWKSNGIYTDWFPFVKGETLEKKFFISDPNNNNEWGLGSFKHRYLLRDNISAEKFYNRDYITIITECMAITPHGVDRTHAAGIWKIKGKSYPEE